LRRLQQQPITSFGAIINAYQSSPRRANDGHLNGREYARLNHEENNLSDRIYFDKHNEARQ